MEDVIIRLGRMREAALAKRRDGLAQVKFRPAEAAELALDAMTEIDRLRADRQNVGALAKLYAGTIDRFKEWYARRAAADRARLVDDIAGWHEKEAERYAGMGRRGEKKREWHAFCADVIRAQWGSEK